nr:rad50-interacting protein 1 [Quercus suber]
MDARVQDYLDDKIQSTADLETLNALLGTVKHQQDLLKQQLAEARRDHANAQREAEEHTRAIRNKAETFQQRQGDIDTQLLIITQSETSDEAVQKFEASMERLRKLDVAAEYVELLKEVDALKGQCVGLLEKDPDAALQPYQKLQHLVTSLQPLQEAAEGAAPHLLDHIARQVKELRLTIQKSFAKDLEGTLRKMFWPKSIEFVPVGLEEEWSTNVIRLLELQRPELEDREQRFAEQATNAEPPVLLPFEVLVQPLEQRFEYHFSGNKPTNRLDKPEYFLAHTSDLLSANVDFVQDAFQPLLLRQHRGTDLALVPAYLDATTAFISALLPMLQRKLASFAPQVVNQPQLLSHLVHEVMSFDTSLQETYAYTPVAPTIPWRGLAFYLLDTLDYFPQWLSVEKDFALSRYQAIVAAPDAGEIDYDFVGREDSKPTKMAIRVNDLVETITERYRPLASFSQKLRFLMDIQIEIFDMLYKRLHKDLEQYQAYTAVGSHIISGVSKEEKSDLQGLVGVKRLCSVFSSAEYLERAMRDWSDDVFFLELWVDLQERARGRDQISSKLDSLYEIQQKTSSAVGSSNGDPDLGGEDQGALFDETATSYRRVRVRAEELLMDTLAANVRDTLRPYTRISTWSSLSHSSSSSSASSRSLSPNLDPTLRLIQQSFTFLRRAVGPAPLRRLARHLCTVIQTTLWDAVLTRATFSGPGAAQLALDVDALAAEIDHFAGPGQARRGLPRLLDGLTLLCLPENRWCTLLRLVLLCCSLRCLVTSFHTSLLPTDQRPSLGRGRESDMSEGTGEGGEWKKTARREARDGRGKTRKRRSGKRCGSSIGR